MRGSILKLVITSVLLCWVLAAGALFIYFRSATWTEDDVSRTGILLAFRDLDTTPPGQRAARLASMKSDYGLPVKLMTLAEARRLAGRPLTAGKPYFVRPTLRQQWVYLVFNDRAGALAVGPLHPVLPVPRFPIGVVLAILLCPIIASAVALRIAQQLKKVERASADLAAGALDARVDNVSGPAHELAASFNAMAARVERLIKERDELIQAISHELGSPLSRLRFQLELLGSDGDRQGSARRLEAITRELDGLDELVAELLRWVQSDEPRLNVEPFDAVQPLSDLVELAQLHEPAGDGASVRAELPPTALIHADQRQFQRAVENLLRNAVRYARSEVSLELSDEGDQVKVTVQDDGPGIPEEQRDKVLQPFTRLDKDRSRQNGGAGLGLAIVNRIVNGHGGSVTIGSSDLGGARIDTTWPKSNTAQRDLPRQETT
jgi:two-component system sensor histidine kinase RstB